MTRKYHKSGVTPLEFVQTIRELKHARDVAEVLGMTEWAVRSRARYYRLQGVDFTGTFACREQRLNVAALNAGVRRKAVKA